jgi:hypothetical protein
MVDIGELDLDLNHEAEINSDQNGDLNSTQNTAKLAGTIP